MKGMINFHKSYPITVVISGILLAACIVGYFTMGFNMGVDFKAGLSQTIKLAMPAAQATYTGLGSLTMDQRSDRTLLVRTGSDVEAKTFEFAFSAYSTIGALKAAMESQVPGFSAQLEAGAAELPSSLLLPAYEGNPVLGEKPVRVYRALKDASEAYASTEQVRKALASMGEVSIQVVGVPADQEYAIRVQDDGKDSAFSKNIPERIRSSLEAAFDSGRVVTMKTEYVGARFSKDLSDNAAKLVIFTLLVILIYATFRFKLQYAIGAILAVLHDALIMVGFVVFTRMEFNTTTIAAILTILGYSINDTIVIFDRIREDRRLMPTDSFATVMNRALTETLGRTIITTGATMLTVLSIFFFTTGSLKDFSLALFVGMVSGTYSTIFIASAFIYYWDIFAQKAKKARELKAQQPAAQAKKLEKPKAKEEPKANAKSGKGKEEKK